MLVLTRKEGEQIYIGEDRAIRVTVVRIDGAKVRVGIDAPRAVQVHRAEIAEAIDREDGSED